MNNRYIEIKNTKPFKFADLIIYFCLSIIIITLFLLFTVFNVNSINAQGFKVYQKGELIFSYNYTTSKTYLSEKYLNQVLIDSENNKITVFANKEKTEYNILEYNKTKKTVSVCDSNCSQSKQCVHTGEIFNYGAIVCAPHGLKVVPFGDGYIPPTIGG